MVVVFDFLCDFNFLLANTFQSDNQESFDDEEYLVANAQNDPALFSKIYDLYFERIFLYIHKRVQNEFVADDITSQTFYLALKYLHRFKFKGFRFSSWLYKIAINELNQFYRQNKNAEFHVALDNYGVERLMKESESGEIDDRLDKLSKVMSTLTMEEIQLIEWRFFESRSFKEIGFFLQISEDNAKTRTYRLLNKVKLLISKLE